jgi:hypothetical protein
MDRNLSKKPQQAVLEDLLIYSLPCIIWPEHKAVMESHHGVSRSWSKIEEHAIVKGQLLGSKYSLHYHH